MTLDEIKNVANRACKEFQVKKLYVYGSFARGTPTESSDLDLLVEFRDPDYAPAGRFFGLLHFFEDVLDCKVDLLTIKSLKNPYFKKRVFEEMVTLYEG